MSAVVTDGQKIDLKTKLRYPKIEFDKLQIYFGEPYVIDLENVRGKITMRVPTVGQFVKAGEKIFYSTINIFTTNTTACRLNLWDVGIDWNEISDFDLFLMSYKQIDSNIASYIFEDIIFSDFELWQKEDKVVLYNEEKDIEINEDVYQCIAQYLRIVFNINIEEKITKDSVLKNMYIQKDRSAIENAKNSKKEKTSGSIQPLISACVNHPGFKYNLQQVKNMSIYEFFDSVNRLNVYESTTAVLKGMYSVMIDGSKFKPDDYNFMKEI